MVTSIKSMITVYQADALLKQNIVLRPSTTMPLHFANGEVLREDIVCPRDIPPYNRVMMDGIALVYQNIRKGQQNFDIEGLQKAGQPPARLKDRNKCIEITTGSALPQTCDCVVPYEFITISNKKARLIDINKIKPRQHIHPKGQDATRGEKILNKFNRLSTPHIAIAASLGKALVKVSQKPTIAIVATGDELVSQKIKPKFFQIFSSNADTLKAALRQAGFTKHQSFHLPDRKKEIKAKLKQLLQSHDIILISGGVSKGKFDYIPEALNELSVKTIFHRVKQRPGKPLWFGRQAKAGPVVFGLPGNPVSGQVCFYRYVLPFLNQCLGLKGKKALKVRLNKAVTFNMGLTYFLPVKLQQSASQAVMNATPLPVNCSGDYIHLNQTDGFIQLPATQNMFPKGSLYPFYPWRENFL